VLDRRLPMSPTTREAGTSPQPGAVACGWSEPLAPEQAAHVRSSTTSDHHLRMSRESRGAIRPLPAGRETPQLPRKGRDTARQSTYHGSVGLNVLAGLTLWCVLAIAAVLGPVRTGRLWRASVGRLRRRDDCREPVAFRPARRPIELIARDAHRLSSQFRWACTSETASFARFEARRRAYDSVLGEACLALGVDHLLAVLPPGPELDAERQRVELRLSGYGLLRDSA
jgi:hypothetical protein